MNWLETLYLGLIIIVGFSVIYHSSRDRRRKQARGFQVKLVNKDERRL